MSLVELMVAMTLGLLIVLAGLIVLSESQVSTAGVSDATRLQIRADGIFRNLSVHLAQGGAVELVDASPGRVVFSDEFTGFDPSASGLGGAAFLHVHGIEGSGTGGTDTLRISYEDDGRARDCLGNRTSNPQGSGASRVDNQYWLQGGRLMCQGSDGSSPQPIAEGVEDFQLTFTVRTGTASNGTYRTYAPSAVPAGAWPQVAAVTVCLRLAGEMANLPQDGSVAGCDGSAVAADGRLRRVLSRTFAIRNALP